MIATRSPASLLLLVAGFAVWGLAFNLLYGAHAVGCELDWQRREIGPLSLQRAQLLGVWAVHLALHLALIVWLHLRIRRTPREPRLERFLPFVSAALAWLALTATLVTGSVVAFLTPCT